MGASVGTSGFSYKHWRGVFYPEDLPESEWLAFYASRFRTVEINTTYYHLPDRSTFERWRQAVPKDFRFVLKGSRYITHMKHLKDAGEPLRRLLTNAAGLGGSLSCVLWQLPARFHRNVERLLSFCESLQREADGVRHAFEFRDESWFDDGVYDVLREHRHALAIAHSPQWPRREVVTAGFTYLRFHGGERTYDSDYRDDELQEWADKARRWLDEGLDLYAFFNNDPHGYAVRNGQRFAELIEDGNRHGR